MYYIAVVLSSELGNYCKVYKVVSPATAVLLNCHELVLGVPPANRIRHILVGLTRDHLLSYNWRSHINKIRLPLQLGSEFTSLELQLENILNLQYPFFNLHYFTLNIWVQRLLYNGLSTEALLTWISLLFTDLGFILNI